MSFAGKQSEEAEEQRVALAITESTAAWLKEIKNKFKGRFLDDVRATYHAVHSRSSGLYMLSLLQSGLSKCSLCMPKIFLRKST